MKYMILFIVFFTGSAFATHDVIVAMPVNEAVPTLIAGKAVRSASQFDRMPGTRIHAGRKLAHWLTDIDHETLQQFIDDNVLDWQILAHQGEMSPPEYDDAGNVTSPPVRQVSQSVTPADILPYLPDIVVWEASTQPGEMPVEVSRSRPVDITGLHQLFGRPDWVVQSP